MTRLAVALMLIALPLQSALVLDIGVTVRIAYLAAALALVTSVWESALRVPVPNPAVWLLLAFVAAVCASVIANPVTPLIPRLVASGSRGIPGTRVLMQLVQLSAMIAIAWLTYSAVRSARDLDRIGSLIVAGGIVAVAYAMYTFAAPYLHLPFIELNNAMNTDFSYGYKEQGNSFVGGYIPRPRSTFPEPLNFANYLLLFIPAVVVRASLATRTVSRLAWGVVAAVSSMLFLFAVNSRGAMAGAVMGIAVVALLQRDLRSFSRATVRAAAAACAGLVLLLVVTSIFVKGGPANFAPYMQRRLAGTLASDSRVMQDWATVDRVFSTHPVIGVGFGNFTFYRGQAEGVELSGVTDAGGVYQRLLAETGVVGTTSYVLFLMALLLLLMHAVRHTQDAVARRWGTGLFFTIVADSVQRVSLVGIATDAHLWVGFGLALAIIALTDPKAAEAAARVEVQS